MKISSQPVVSASLAVIGRVMLATIFLMSAVGNKIPNFSSVAETMSSVGVPAAPVMLACAILFLVAGSLSIIAGYKTQLGAGLLIIFLALATYYFHNFWSFAPDSPEFQMQMIQFMKNLGLAGAMVLLIVNGPGPASFDQHQAARRQAAA